MILATLLSAALAQAPAPSTPAPAPAPAPAAPQAAPAAPAPPAASVLTLAEALNEARKSNLDLQIASARLDQAHELSSKVWANYLPQLAVGGSYTRNNVEATIKLPTGYNIRNVGQPTSGPFDPSKPVGIDNPPGAPTTFVMVPSGFAEAVIQKKNQLGAQASLSQALIAPALWPAIKNAYLAEHVAELNVEAARRDVLFGVAQLYYGAVGLLQAVQVNERLLELNREHEKYARVRFEAGSAPKLLLVRAELDRAGAEQNLRRAQNSYAAAKLALATLLDRQPDFEVVQPPEPPEPPQGDLMSQAQANRPDLQAAAANVDLAQRVHDAVWYQFFPTLGLQAQYRLTNVKGFTGTYDSWAVSLGLSWLIYDGGLRQSALREDASKVVEAQATERAAQNRARSELQKALLDLDSARANKQKAAEQLELAKENMRLVNVNLEAGVATPVDVADAQTALASAELGLVGESLNASLAAISLAKAAGAFDPR